MKQWVERKGAPIRLPSGCGGLEPDYDVVVVGGGPAGATAARCLVEERPEARVLLVEKEKMPRDKPCGGFVASQLLEAFSFLRGREHQFIESESREGILHSPDLRYQVGGRTRMLAVLRSTFDAYLAGLAQQAGVTISTGRRVQDLSLHSDGAILLLEGGGRVTARAVVGADGAASLVARRAGLHQGWRPNQVCRCIVREIPVEPEFIADSYGPLRTVHLYLQFNGLPGYAWVFPKARHINVGIGCFASHPARLSDYYRLLLRLLRRWEMLPSTTDTRSLRGVKAGICPVDGPLPLTQTDRVILVGDAAGFVSPATGAGILPAMISGQLAAQTLSQAPPL